MNRTRAKIVLCLALFAGLAMVAGALIDPPQFDLVSGAEWSQRAAQAIHPVQAAPLVAPLVADHRASPAIASGLILLAGGLIVSVMAFAIHMRTQVESLRLNPLRTR